MSVAVFLPTRKGSVRVPQKNTRSFAGISGGLLQLKLEQLIKIQEVEEIILSTNDENSHLIAEKYLGRTEKLKIVPRPEELSTSETDLEELIKYIPQLTQAEHILWTHVTSPFCNEKHYSKIVEKYFEVRENAHDSLVSVQKFNNFLWDEEKKDIINREGTEQWPRTQDLKPLYEINNAVFLAPRNFHLRGERLGTKPFLYEMEKIPSLDIDDNEDFEIAEAVYERRFL